jgi:hypothetical protein
MQALVLIAGLLWSGVCLAQCRVLPSSKSHAKQSGKPTSLPPCHQQQQQSSSSDSDCKEEGCPAGYADAEKSLDGFVPQEASSNPSEFAIVPLSLQARCTVPGETVARPSDSISILRI